MRYIVLILTQCILTHVSAGTYQLADLKHLYLEKNYLEYFDHALDIAPANRDGEWGKMTTELALGFLEDLNQRGMSTAREDELVYKISSWPIFKQDEVFQEKRNIIFMRYLSQCEKDCHQLRDKIFFNYPHSLRFNFQFVRFLHKNGVNTSQLWRYTKALAASPFGEFYCHKKPIDDILIEKLLSAVETHQDILPLLHQDCLEKLKPKILQALYQNSNKKGLKALVSTLNIKDAQAESYIQLVDYLNGDMSDQNLQNLKSIRQDHTLRNQLAQKIKVIDPLPGKIFSTQNRKQRLSQIRILDRSFPEFITYYTHTCLGYLEGTQTFAKGNPTPDCHGLFEINQSLKIIPADLQRRYQKATYFMHKKRPL